MDDWAALRKSAEVLRDQANNLLERVNGSDLAVNKASRKNGHRAKLNGPLATGAQRRQRYMRRG